MNTLQIVKEHLISNDIAWLFDQRALANGIEAFVILAADKPGTGIRIWSRDDEVNVTVAHCDRFGYPVGPELSLTSGTPEMIAAAIEMMRASA